jgi:hypothetical protein
MFSEEMTCCGSKNDFYKKSGGLLFSAKVQNHPCSSEIGRELAQNSKNSSKGCATKRELIFVSPGCLLFMWGVFPSFRYRISVAASQKNPISFVCLGAYQAHRSIKKPYFGTLKMEKALFVGRNENRPVCYSFTSQGTRTCLIWPRSNKLYYAHGQI